MLSRETKGIASRSPIRVRPPIAKGHRQRYAKPVDTGNATWSGTAEEIPDQNGIEVRHGMLVLNRVGQRMVIPVIERVMRRVGTGIRTRPVMGDKTRMAMGVKTRFGHRVDRPIATQMQKPVQMPMWERMAKQAMRRIEKRSEN